MAQHRTARPTWSKAPCSTRYMVRVWQDRVEWRNRNLINASTVLYISWLTLPWKLRDNRKQLPAWWLWCHCIPKLLSHFLMSFTYLESFDCTRSLSNSVITNSSWEEPTSSNNGNNAIFIALSLDTLITTSSSSSVCRSISSTRGVRIKPALVTTEDIFCTNSSTSPTKYIKMLMLYLGVGVTHYPCHAMQVCHTIHRFGNTQPLSEPIKVTRKWASSNQNVPICEPILRSRLTWFSQNFIVRHALLVKNEDHCSGQHISDCLPFACHQLHLVGEADFFLWRHFLSPWQLYHVTEFN